jgi:hypothetical protein
MTGSTFPDHPSPTFTAPVDPGFTIRKDGFGYNDRRNQRFRLILFHRTPRKPMTLFAFLAEHFDRIR